MATLPRELRSACFPQGQTVASCDGEDYGRHMKCHRSFSTEGSFGFCFSSNWGRILDFLVTPSAGRRIQQDQPKWGSPSYHGSVIRPFMKKTLSGSFVALGAAREGRRIRDFYGSLHFPPERSGGWVSHTLLKKNNSNTKRRNTMYLHTAEFEIASYWLSKGAWPHFAFSLYGKYLSRCQFCNSGCAPYSWLSPFALQCFPTQADRHKILRYFLHSWDGGIWFYRTAQIRRFPEIVSNPQGWKSTGKCRLLYFVVAPESLIYSQPIAPKLWILW